MAAPRSSTPTKGASSPATSSQDFSPITTFRSAWTAQATGGITCLWNELWERITYEEVSSHVHETMGAVPQDLARYLMFYTQTRPYQAVDGQTPDQA